MEGRALRYAVFGGRLALRMRSCFALTSLWPVSVEITASTPCASRVLRTTVEFTRRDEDAVNSAAEAR